VLRSPYPEQEGAFEQMIARGAEAVEMVLASGMVKAMNIFNRSDTGAEAPAHDS
jgi:hypothetical protein